MLLLALALACAASLPAPPPTLRVRIPFDFQAGESRFGPGEYLISLSATGSIRLEGRDRRVTIRAPGLREAASGAAPAVSFRAYGDHRFLASVHAEGRTWELDPSAGERSTSLHWGSAPTVLSLKAEPR